MVRKFSSVAIVGLFLMLPAFAAGEIDIPYKKFVLDNGLTLIVSEDHKAPIVAVNVWYHVGSKNEKVGKTGFAHLFEHLMFNGSENFNDDYFKPFDRVGSTDMNGTTNFDRTNYFQNVPSTALDMALWMESDRMGHLLGAIDQAKLDEQRGVVQNEKRQGENQPYGRAFLNIFENTYPKGHPYSWSVIGSLDDLQAASLDDVHQWFKDYYGAANAVLTVVGDVKTDEVKQKVEQYFGDIPSGPPVTRQKSWIEPRKGDHRQVLEDRVPQARLYKVWNIPEVQTVDAANLGLVNSVLTRGKTSRLYKRLVFDDQIATDVTGFNFDRELGGLFIMWATVQPGGNIDAVEKAMDEEIAKFLKDGPTPAEVQRVTSQFSADFIRGIEQIGGFQGKANTLATNEVFTGNPEFYKTTLQRVASATPAALLTAAKEWISDGAFVLEVHPYSDYKTIATNVDRSKVPETTEFPEAVFAATERGTLSNGMKVIVAPHRAVPMVDMRLIVDAGFAADQGGIPGTGSLTLDMMDEGTNTRTALQISEQLGMIGANLFTSSTLDTSTITMDVLKEKLDQGMAIWADVILHPSFPADQFARKQKETIAAIGREKVSPFSMALRVFPKLLYSEGHAYGEPFTGTGDEESVKSLTTEALRKYHSTWIRPNASTLVVVGDTNLAEMKPKLEKLFAEWQKADTPKKNLATVSQKGQPEVYIIDRPDSIQSFILAGHIAPPKSDPDDLAITAVNEVLGASFTARINMNLREGKHWSYGARSAIFAARGQRPFFVFAPVQTDKTMESMREVQKELDGIVGVLPPTADELARTKDKTTKALPGQWETNDEIADAIVEMVEFGLPEDYWKTYPGKVNALTLDKVTATAKKIVQPSKVVWVVVGDRKKIEEGIRQLALGDVQLMDANGKVIGEKVASD